ncbi:cell wall metabolism sensor histidine kinase WalK [Commensalibacter papalotli (ex Botero et al. 2024)]|uniref:histidine kinase n=1 Tax=Commensalibacter papalotli (ex Botero et al. 2024) TaxID=2972766 RepID=A0ABN8WGX9_9PROT|nr:ATP-binding protein [Commensalibacter papalotli (ex Botero et al. 2024)]CAI3956472.1 Sensor histidine kinase WalK (WalK) (PDB:4I5S) [Commensalibacter papalotli (ex Botero et al. 2024)]CAI3956939.1 Sensor histidine kinase WalK (WalK) (PDB:4I5S) [Commensalibacter papalotli (ex Botero et al. 2024)]
MFSEDSFYTYLLFFFGGGFVSSLIWLFAYRNKTGKVELEQYEVIKETYHFNRAFTELKQTVDHIQAPILLIASDYAYSSISLRNQIKHSFSLFSNSIAYEKNLYLHQHYDDVILDILRHPVFCQTVEEYMVSPVSEIEIHLELPKSYQLKLLFSAYEPSNILKNILVITLIDQSQIISLNQMRSDFIAHASHELRTPLTSLDGFIQTLLGVGVDDEQTQKQFLEIMHAQVGRMIRLTNGLLTLSRVERDEYRLLTDRVDLKLVLQQILQESQFMIKKAGITLNYQDEIASQNVIIFADKDQLFQIFHNIIENAIRHAPLGNAEIPLITARLYFTEDHLKWPGLGWVISISDNGPGIEKKHLPRLTERFYRAGDKHNGTGLGLAIVKHLVARHKGIFVIESQMGQGSCFSIWFPMHYA